MNILHSAEDDPTVRELFRTKHLRALIEIGAGERADLGWESLGSAWVGQKHQKKEERKAVPDSAGHGRVNP
ncbi:MAG: hypothetical protein ABEH38_08180 [Flavobacteriales bacterium]